MLILEIAAGVFLGGLALSVVQSPKIRPMVTNLLFATVLIACISIVGGVFFLVFSNDTAARYFFGVSAIILFPIVPPFMLQKIIKDEFHGLHEIISGESAVHGSALRLTIRIIVACVYLTLFLAGLLGASYMLNLLHVYPQYLTSLHLY